METTVRERYNSFDVYCHISTFIFGVDRSTLLDQCHPFDILQSEEFFMPPVRKSSSSRKSKSSETAPNMVLIGGIGAGVIVVIVAVVIAMQSGRSQLPTPPIASTEPAAPIVPVATQAPSAPIAAATPAMPVFDQGPPPLPDKFVFEPLFVSDQKPIAAATAFAVRHADFPTPIILSCLNIFPVDTRPQDLPKLIKKVTLADKFTGSKLGEFEGSIIAIPDSAPIGNDSYAGDIIALWSSPNTGVTAANMSTKGMRQGEPIWMATRINGDGVNKLHKAVVTRVEPNALQYKFDNAILNFSATAGSPMLNAKGEVVAIHLGENKSIVGIGVANPVGTFLPHLVAGCRSTPPSSQTLALRELSGTDLVEFVEPSVVVIRVVGQYGDSLGSGFVVDKSGQIVTNYHVIEGAKSATAVFRTKEEFEIKGYWALDPLSDLAVLQIDCPADKLHPVTLAKELPKKGEAVAAFGAPYGLDFSYTKGDVSALREGTEFKRKGQYIQTSAAISQGNSGGPLTNMKGEVVGVNSFKRASGENLNFAISAMDVTSILAKKAGYLGKISPTDIPDRSGGHIKAEDLTGTERGNVLLGRIHEAVVIIEGVTYDPTGRLETFVLRNCESAIYKQFKWKRLTRRDQPSASTAFMVIVVYFDFDESKRDLVTEIHILTQIIARDVDENRRPIVALVYKEDVTVGTVSVKALVNGIIPRTLETSVPKSFNKLATAYKKAARGIESGAK